MIRKTGLLVAGIITLFVAFALLESTHTRQVSAAPELTPTDTCGLTVEIIAAPYAVVDSNKPGVEGPKVGTMGARITNNSGSTVTDVYAHIGNGTTPGAFQSVSGGSLSMLSALDTSHFLNDLAPGESVTAYFPIRYPFTFDVSYPYTIWASNAAGCYSSDADTRTTQDEISATANKLLPVGSTLMIYPQTASPGGTITVEIRGFELGTIGQGPKERSPYDAWLQPVGNLDFDPTCLRLVRSEVKLGSISGTPFIDQLYFEQIRDYNGQPDDYVRYTFLALRACATTVQPYQEAASGTQEKYNGDFETSTSRIQVTSGSQSNLNLTLTADTETTSPGDTITYTNTFYATSGTAGYPDNGSPVVIESHIPDGTSYISGSTTTSHTADTQYSSDDGSTWSNSEPTGDVTDIRWILDEPVDTSPHTTTYSVTTETSGPITASSESSLLDAFTLTSSTTAVNSDGGPTPTPSPTPDPDVSSGSGGGLESEPLDVEPSAFLEDGSGVPAVAPTPQPDRHKAIMSQQAPMSLSLSDFLPSTGPDGTTPTDVVPVDVLAVTDAPDAQAVDFVDAQGNVKAVVLGIHTLNGPYEHDYGVCNRFKEYSFDAIAPVGIAGLEPAQPGSPNWFWNAKAQKGDNIHEDAFIYHIFVDEGSQKLHIDSRWIQNSYPDTFDFAFDYVFNMQVWSSNQADSEMLLGAMFDQMRALNGGAWDLIFHNAAEPTAPQLFISETSYDADIVRLTINNTTGGFQTAVIDGTWRSYADRNTLIPVNMTINLPPGKVELSLPFPGLLDTTLFLHHNGFTDKIYNGGGLWFTFTNSDQATAAFELGECRGLEGIRDQDLLLAGCITFTGGNVTTADAVGLGRTLNPNGRPVNVSPYESLRFWARGDGSPVRILLETADISDGDFYQLTFTPASDWQQYTLPLAQFTQRGYGEAKPLNLAEVRSVIWLNAAATNGSFLLELDQVSFTNSDAVQVVQQPSDSSNTGPQTVTINAANAQQATLYYSRDLGFNYTAVAMTQSGTQFTAAIPGQPLGSDILYYIATETADGYVQRLPLDAPASTFRYRVDDRASLLVDDFGGSHVSNRLLRPTGTFNGSNGSISAVSAGSTLALSYNVGQEGAFAGYFSLLGSVNASSYTTLNILARGSSGGEQLLISLKDGAGFEPRISAGDVLPGGLTDDWQWIQLPLSAFDSQLDRSSLQSIALSFANGHGRSQGTVFIREIRFTALPAPHNIDTFNDGNLQLNGRGQPYWQTTQGASLTATAVGGDAQLPTGYALKLDYGVQPGGYALWTTPLGGLQASTDMALSFFVRGIDTNFAPNLYLSDGSNRARVALAPYLAAGSGWQRVSIPLNAFAGINPNNLRELQVAFEFGSGSGSIWLDQISIGRSGTPRADRRTVHLDGVHGYTAAIHSASMQLLTVSGNRPWLALSRPATSPTTLGIQAVGAGMPAGTYTGQVIVSNPGGASETINVILTISADAQASYLYFPIVRR